MQFKTVQSFILSTIIPKLDLSFKNLQLLMTQIYTTKSGLTTPLVAINDSQRRRRRQQSTTSNDSQLPKVQTTAYGIETVSFLGNRLWSTLPSIVKQASTLPIFKNHIKCWKGGNGNLCITMTTWICRSCK